jgi:hypothetical protein
VGNGKWISLHTGYRFAIFLSVVDIDAVGHSAVPDRVPRRTYREKFIAQKRLRN